MSVFGGNQVGEIIVGKTYGDEADLVDFMTNGTDGDVQIFSGNGTAVSEGPFKVLQKTDSAVGGIEYTEVINPSNITSIKAEAYRAPVQRELKVTGFTGTVRVNATYEVFIRLYNDGGTLSPENFRQIPAFYVTREGDTFEDILNGLKTNIDKTLARESSNLFNVTVDTAAGEFIVSGNNVPFVLGVKDGRAVEFDLQAVVRSNGSFSNPSGNYFDDLTVETVQAGDQGSGTGNQVANLEWFLKGNKYSRYRDVAYPNNFNTPYVVNPGSTYHIVNVSYFKEREYTNVEKQHRYTYFVFEAADQDGAGAGTDFTAVNAFINDLEVATGKTIADLA